MCGSDPDTDFSFIRLGIGPAAWDSVMFDLHSITFKIWLDVSCSYQWLLYFAPGRCVEHHAANFVLKLELGNCSGTLDVLPPTPQPSISFYFHYFIQCFDVGRQEENPAWKNWVICLDQVQMACIWASWWHCHPIVSCFIKIQTGLTFVVLAYWGCPGKEVVKWAYVCLQLNGDCYNTALKVV